MRGRHAAAATWVPPSVSTAIPNRARVCQLAQLRKQEVRQEGEHWVIRLTPEAGTINTNEARTVVLRPHLIELGFPAFVEATPPGPTVPQAQRSGMF